jgi:hypothetical protein
MTFETCLSQAGLGHDRAGALALDERYAQAEAPAVSLEFMRRATAP